MSRELNNIEELLLDYLDGKLDKSKTAFVERYLANNPDVAEEIAGLSDIKVTPDYNIKYADKSSLKRSKEFKLPLYTKWAVAAAGTLLVGALIWLSVENNQIRKDYAALQNSIPEIETTSRPVIQKAQSKPENSKIINQKTEDNSGKAFKQMELPKSKKRVRSKYNLDGSTQTAIAQQVTVIKGNPDLNEIKTMIDLARQDNLNALAVKKVPEVKRENTWNKPVILEESTVVVFEEMDRSKSLAESILPFHLSGMQGKIKNKLKEVTTENMKEKLKNAFQFQKLKEALVPSSVQNDVISSIQ